MQSTAVNDFTPATSLLQVGSYFDIVDNAVKTGFLSLMLKRKSTLRMFSHMMDGIYS
jgi:hypothetical protein